MAPQFDFFATKTPTNTSRDPEDSGIRVLRNAGTFLPDHMTTPSPQKTANVTGTAVSGAGAFA
jgi:hypothetical protein